MRQEELSPGDGPHYVEELADIRLFGSSGKESDGVASQNQTKASHTSVSEHIYARGFREGAFADIVVSAFGRDWKLHRIVLSRLPYFNSMFEGGWKESSESCRLELSFDDPVITSSAFEAMLDSLYGGRGKCIDDTNVFNLMATAAYFGMPDLMESCTMFMLANISQSNLNRYLGFAVNRYFGDFSTRIQEACYTILCRDSRDRLRSCLYLLPGEWLRKVLASEALYIESEFERYQLVVEVMQHRAGAVAVHQKRFEDGVCSDQQLRRSLSGMTLTDLPSCRECDCSGSRLLKPSSCHSDCPPSDVKESAPTSGCSHWPGVPIVDPDIICSEELYADDREVFDYLLNCGVFYTHMTFGEIRSVLADGLVCEEVLQRAWWRQGELRACVIGTDPNEQALVCVTADSDDKIDSKTGSTSNRRDKRLYHIPAHDKTQIVNFTATVPFASSSGTPYSVYEPFRFSVEFSAINEKQPKLRHYSKCFFYAGSMWNLYIQKVCSTVRKQPQIGVYLKRQACGKDAMSSIPAADKISYYEEPRKATKTWFKVYCASRGPTHVITAFQSKADIFTNKQSWGWRSAALSSDDYLVTQIDDPEYSRSGSLRFSVVLGHV